jgi:hypothetical protein
MGNLIWQNISRKEWNGPGEESRTEPLLRQFARGREQRKQKEVAGAAKADRQ